MTIQKFAYTHKTDTNTLLNFIAQKLTVSKNKAKQLLDRRMVFVNKKRVWIASYQLNKGDAVEVIMRDIKAREFEKEGILFKDNHYLVVSKPPDMITNGTESLEESLRTYFHDNHIQAVHRLDRDTSGAVIFAMNKDAFGRMKTLFKKNLIKKIYRAMVRGGVGKQSFTIDTAIEGQKAVTHTKLLKKGKEASYLEVNIETGRTHQIRIHLASIGHPVIGETEYDRKPIEHPLLRQIRRQMLHAYQVSFIHPFTQKTVSVTANIPDDFNQGLMALGLGNRSMNLY